MLISTKGRYALQFMIYVARADAIGPVAVRSVGEMAGISVKYLEQLAHALAKKGLLTSVRGKGGGYRLARPASQISAGDILRSVEKSTSAVACTELDGGTCPREAICSTVDFWAGLDDVIDAYVDGVMLDELAFPQGQSPWHGWLHDASASMEGGKKEAIAMGDGVEA